MSTGLGLSVRDVRDLVVAPGLRAIDLWSPGAEALVLGTAVHESRLSKLRQYGTGPALGLFQMEPETHDDIWRNWLVYRAGLAAAIRELVSLANAHAVIPDARELAGNLPYAAAMARCQYRRHPEPIPDPRDVDGMAALWKLRYNTPLGDGTVEQFASAYWTHVLPLYQKE